MLNNFRRSIMASSHPINYWSGGPATGNRRFATSSANFVRAEPGGSSKTRFLRGDFVPVYVALGLITASVVIGYHTIKQQLRYAPGVYVSKKRRETFPEVEDPDKVVGDVDNLRNKSLFRKVANVQESEYAPPDPIKKEVFQRHDKTETLKPVGVDPGGH